MQSPVRSAGRLGLFVLLALAPLIMSLIQLDPGRGFWVNVSVAAGFVGLSLMGLQFVLAARSVQVTGLFGPDVTLRFHRQMTVLIAILIFAHPIILMLWDSRFLALLNVVTSPLRAKLAVLSVFLLAVLIVTSVWRRRLRLSYQVWQTLHTLLAVAIVTTGLIHVLLIGYYVDQPWEKVLWIVYSAAFIWIGVWVRLVRPITRWRRRWRVTSLREHTSEVAHTITLELVDPDSYGSKGFAFEAGQYAWIHTGSHPFALDYHPFSFSSSAEQPDRVEFTIKTENGFTKTVHDLEPGRTIYLDGPWGQMCLDRHEGPGFVFVASGVGVTPMLSMLATMADRADRRPCWLILGNRHDHDIIGAQQIDALRGRLDLTTVHVISQPSPDWTGQRGRIGRAVLDEVLPANRARLQYFLCGAEAMMQATEEALAELGVPQERVHAERFAMA